ncbi:hypothetical protein KFL_001950110 [Klebsormidium nitens]|uniref:LTD domain-containing protein n=1 Tax=Klebsormidium nitens TaxID=105231 RepID=A0A1Y1I909_KLENI|nr:hypothetical protein KFL_001950110 [Klebsormidium nitens]|eukprot:GAQ84578.1 hypothetical protein KFL_001950110 [Klebsormidium nitens]
MFGTMAPLTKTLALVLLLALVAASAEGRTMRSLLQTPGSLPPVFLDEIHWDNAALDFGEAVEIFGPAGTDLSGWTVTRYLSRNAGGNICMNADTSQQNAGVKGPCGVGNPFTIPAGTTIPSQTVANGIGYGTVVVLIPNNGLVNGGVAVVLANAQAVVQDYLFFGAPSPLTLVGGPANGQTVTNNIGSGENGNGPIGNSIQRFGPTTYDTTTNGAPNTFGTAYQAYLPVSANPGGISSSNLDANTGLVNFPAGTTTAAGTTPLQPTSWNTGPIVLSPGGLPSATVLTNLIIASGIPAGSITPAPTTQSPTTTPAPTTFAPTTTPSPTTQSPTTTPAPTTLPPATPGPTILPPVTPAPTTSAPITPAPTSGIYSSPSASTCTALAPGLPNPCFNNDGSKFVCCAGACAAGTPGAAPACAGGPTSAPTTAAPTTAAPVTPAPTTSAPTPGPTFATASGATCNAYSANSYSCYSSDGFTFACCPTPSCAPGGAAACAGAPTAVPTTAAPVPTTAAPVPTTAAPVPTSAVFPTGSGNNCNPVGQFQCFNNDGSLYTCCIGPRKCAPGTPGPVPACA